MKLEQQGYKMAIEPMVIVCDTDSVGAVVQECQRLGYSERTDSWLAEAAASYRDHTLEGTTRENLS